MDLQLGKRVFYVTGGSRGVAKADLGIARVKIFAKASSELSRKANSRL
jgi:hypothetical protein